MKTLYNRLTTLISNSCSGIVDFSGNPDDQETLCYMAYFHSLGYVFYRRYCASSYFDVKCSNTLNKALSSFCEIAEHHSLAEIHEFESNHLQSIFSDLLWHMAHEQEIDNHTYTSSDFWEIPAILNDFDEFATYTLGYADDLESDVIGFHECARAGSDFSVLGMDFHLGCPASPDDSWTLYRTCLEPFTDDETGESFMILRYHPIISCNNWRSLYAVTRAVIYNRAYSS